MGEIYDLYSGWQSVFARLIQNIPPGERREFWKLIGVGKADEFQNANLVFELFKDVGLLHVLVLSGSQVGVLVRMFRHISRSIRLVLGLHPMMGHGVDTALRYLLLWCYVGGTGFSAPLVRAALVHEVDVAASQATIFLKCVLAFLIHIYFFREQMTSASFILSWGAFGALVILGQLRLPKWTMQCFLSLFCHLLVVALKGIEFPSFYMWIKILVANLLFLGIFDLVVFPLVAVLVLMSLVILIVGSESIMGIATIYFFDSFALIYDGIAGLILCAIRTIRYI